MDYILEIALRQIALQRTVNGAEPGAPRLAPADMMDIVPLSPAEALMCEDISEMEVTSGVTIGGDDIRKGLRSIARKTVIASSIVLDDHALFDKSGPEAWLPASVRP